MSRRQLLFLFGFGLISNIIAYIYGAIIPIYLARIVIDDASIIGIYLAISYLSLSLGVIVGGWFSDRYQNRVAGLLVTVIIRALVFWLHGQSSDFTSLILLSTVFTFFGGISIAIISALIGHSAGENERGMVFSIIWANLALGALIGGFSSGYVVELWGFRTLFTLGAIVTIVLQVPLALLIRDKPIEQVSAKANQVGWRAWFQLGRPFYLLFLASNIAYITPYIGLLARPLVMESLGFDVAANTSTIAASGLISLPLTLVVGWLSDRMERVILLIGCYVLNVLGMILLAEATLLWHYQLSAGLLLGVNASLGVGSALITDRVDRAVLGRALSLFTASAYIGGISGSLITGYSMELVGIYPTFLGGAVLPIIAILILLPIWRRDGRADKQVNVA